MDALGLKPAGSEPASKAGFARPPLPSVISQHVEDAAVLRHARRVLVAAPHVRLHHLARVDERLAAHLDGITVAGETGRRLARAALAAPQTGEMFVAAVGVIESGDAQGLRKLFALAEAVPASRAGLLSAFGWVSAGLLKGVIAALLEDDLPLRRMAGLAACTMHRVDPGAALARLAAADDAGTRARALRCIGQSGRRDLRDLCLRHLVDDDPACAFHAAWSAALLGDRDAALASLRRICAAPNPWRDAALSIALKILPLQEAHALLKALPHEPMHERRLIRAIGIAGDPAFCPWLIGRMHAAAYARLAGESFSLITGLDLAAHGLDRPPPAADDDAGADADDPAPAMDEDDGLPWPMPERIADWWSRHRQDFAAGTRSFMGAPASAAHCAAVLREGGQRQRAAAAEMLCLLQPGMPLFPTRAPAWRQLRWLSA